jgi:CBS domain-containing protein
VPVLDDTGRLVVGVVSESDLALKEVAPLREAHIPAFETPKHRGERAKAASLTAAELMTAPAVTVGPEELVAAAARRMYDRRIKWLPVAAPCPATRKSGPRPPIPGSCWRSTGSTSS